MKFLYSKGHILVNFGNGYYVLDTGSPTSFSYIGEKTIDVNGKQYQFGTIITPKTKEMIDLIGEDISGFIGMDILKDNGFSVNYHTNEIEFTSKNHTYNCYIAFEMDVRGFIKTNQVMLNDSTISGTTIIDTGASISYISKKYIKPGNKTSETYNDYHPQYKQMHGNYYNVDKFFAVLGHGRTFDRIKVGLVDDCPLLKQTLQMAGVDNVVSPKEFGSNSWVTFDFKDNLIYIDK